MSHHSKELDAARSTWTVVLDRREPNRLGYFQHQRHRPRISDKTSLPTQIRPSRPNQWLWHPVEWYEERLLKSVEAVASSSPWAEQNMGCPLSVLEEEIVVPPPLSRCVWRTDAAANM